MGTASEEKKRGNLKHRHKTHELHLAAFVSPPGRGDQLGKKDGTPKTTLSPGKKEETSAPWKGGTEWGRLKKRLYFGRERKNGRRAWPGGGGKGHSLHIQPPERNRGPTKWGGRGKKKKTDAVTTKEKKSGGRLRSQQRREVGNLPTVKRDVGKKGKYEKKRCENKFQEAQKTKRGE